MKIKYFFFIAFIICNVAITNAQTNISGLIATNSTWYKSKSPYIVTGNIAVDQGVTLTIEPGVKVKFGGLYYLYIDGTLNAQGTEVDSIWFTSSSSTLNAGIWKEIKLRPTSKANIIKYCHIEYAQKGVQIDNHTSTQANGFTISNSLIINNQIGIYSYFDNGGLVSNNVIRNNQLGISSYSTIMFDIDGNKIIYNSSGGIGDASWGIFVSIGKIKNNIISHNNGYGLYWHSGASSTFAEFTGNTIDGNTKDGIYLSAYPANVTNPFINNIIINNKESGIQFDVGTVNMSNNQISGNKIGILNNQSVNAQNFSITQNCIYNNEINYKQLNTYNVDLNNNWWGSTDSIEVGLGIYDYYDDFTYGKVLFSPLLKNNAPICALTGIEVSTKTSSSISIFPNPFSQSATLKFENPDNEKHSLTLIDIEGRVVAIIPGITTNRITIEKNELTSGFYYYQLQTDRKILATGKFVVE